MSSTHQEMSTEPIKISYEALKSSDETLGSSIQAALGSEPGCLGIILVDDLPVEFLTLREKLFHLSHRLANLPEDVREGLSRPHSKYMFGWSHGKEVMNGRPDTQKGSFYANPLSDQAEVNQEQRETHPEYYSGNIWPKSIEGLEDFERTFKSLGNLIYEVGLALARACEPFVLQATSSTIGRSIEDIIRSSQSNKARLLHYYPESRPPFSEETDLDALCGTHLDHSLLTGLCSAMYLATLPNNPSALTEVKAPSSTTGLYIYPRHSNSSSQPDPVKVSIPPNCLAFQTGEALELLTNGKLAATPHFVSGNRTPSTSNSIDASNQDKMDVSRETFAFFLQPDVDDIIGHDGETFGTFTKRVLGRHYGAETEAEG